MRVNFDISRLPLCTAAGLMDHGSRVGQYKALAFGTTTEQKRTHGSGLTDTHGADIGLNKLHRIVNGQPRRHGPAWAVDV